MKKQGMKRMLALVLAAAMFLALCACTSKSGAQPSGKTETKTTGDGKLFTTPADISIVVQSHPSWPYNENWPAWKYFREATGAALNVTAVPSAEFETKLTLIMADKNSLPDLIYIDNKPLVDGFASTGALIAIDDYLDEMPNYTKFWDSISKEERESRLLRRRSADGKTYFPQNYGTDSLYGIKSWLYRKDIFEKHNLKIPKTMDELYDVALKLKKLYPDSYPVCIRDGFTNLTVIGSEWKPHFSYGLYYDFENKTWHYGATEPTMREMVEYFLKLRNAGLVTPDYLTIKAKSWEELMSTDRGFILPDYVVRVDYFNTPNRKQNPEYTLAEMTPPSANTPTARNLVNKFNIDPKGYMICNTGKKDRIKNAVKLVDWMYSDEAAQLLGWGKEGETYKTVDAKKEFIRPEDGDIQGKYGLNSYGLYLRIDPEAGFNMASEEQQAAIMLALDSTEKEYNPSNWMAFGGEDSKTHDVLLEAIDSYTKEMLSKFLYGQEPMTNWDTFVKTLGDLGVNDLISLYDRTYTKLTK